MSARVGGPIWILHARAYMRKESRAMLDRVSKIFSNTCNKTSYRRWSRVILLLSLPAFLY